METITIDHNDQLTHLTYERWVEHEQDLSPLSTPDHHIWDTKEVEHVRIHSPLKCLHPDDQAELERSITEAVHDEAAWTENPEIEIEYEA